MTFVLVHDTDLELGSWDTYSQAKAACDAMGDGWHVHCVTRHGRLRMGAA